MDVNNELIQFFGISLLSLLNIIVLAYQTMKKVPKEVDKMQAEKAESYAEAAESNMQGAQISNELLMQRIKELKKDKADAWNHIAKLEKQLIESEQKPVPFVASDTAPSIKAIKKQ